MFGVNGNHLYNLLLNVQGKYVHTDRKGEKKKGREREDIKVNTVK